MGCRIPLYSLRKASDVDSCSLQDVALWLCSAAETTVDKETWLLRYPKGPCEAGYIFLFLVSVYKVPFNIGECMYLVSFWGYKK